MDLPAAYRLHWRRLGELVARIRESQRGSGGSRLRLFHLRDNRSGPSSNWHIHQDAWNALNALLPDCIEDLSIRLGQGETTESQQCTFFDTHWPHLRRLSITAQELNDGIDYADVQARTRPFLERHAAQLEELRACMFYFQDLGPLDQNYPRLYKLEVDSVDTANIGAMINRYHGTVQDLTLPWLSRNPSANEEEIVPVDPHRTNLRIFRGSLKCAKALVKGSIRFRHLELFHINDSEDLSSSFSEMYDNNPASAEAVSCLDVCFSSEALLGAAPRFASLFSATAFPALTELVLSSNKMSGRHGSDTGLNLPLIRNVLAKLRSATALQSLHISYYEAASVPPRSEIELDGSDVPPALKWLFWDNSEGTHSFRVQRARDTHQVRHSIVLQLLPASAKFGQVDGHGIWQLPRGETQLMFDHAHRPPRLLYN
ncbi:hypothetical protein OC861_003148 [Tilletia horrida]|nr:hypothetical protein OC861_003148 [Tilletia horrida]